MKKIKASLEGKDVNSYAYKISKIRIDNNLTQSELADRLGLSDKTISAWEKGKTEPDNDSVKKLCNEFGMSLSSVMFEKKTIKDHYSTMIKSPEFCNAHYCELYFSPLYKRVLLCQEIFIFVLYNLVQ